MKFLIGQGAEVDRGDNKGETALVAASKKGKEEIVRFLESKGAKKSEKKVIKTQAQREEWLAEKKEKRNEARTAEKAARRAAKQPAV